jgi:hypothetical protein
MRRPFFSLKRVLWGVLGLVGAVAVALFHGGLGAVGHQIVEKSPVIQHEIEVIQHEIEEWIMKLLHTDESAAMRPEDLTRLCTERAMKVMPTKGLPGFIESKGYCLRNAGAFNAL